MQLSWKTAALAAAVLAAPLARAHDVECEKTVNGAQILEVTSYPVDLNYEWTLRNLAEVPSVVESVSDSMLPISLEVPFTIPVGGTTSGQYVLEDLTYEQCVERANYENEAALPIILNTLTVGFDGGTKSCWAKVICKPPENGNGGEDGEGCLTRTPGFWGTHPDVAAEFLPVDSCALTLVTTTAGAPASVTEDLCSNQVEYDSPQEAQLVRQCAAAALNIAASEALGGSCDEFTGRFAECCGADFCNADVTAAAINASGCIDDLDAFNNSEDTLLDDGEELELCDDPPCAAEPEACQEAGDNDFVNPRPGATPAIEGDAIALSTGSNPSSGGCSGGPGGLLALLGTVGLLARLRRRS